MKAIFAGAMMALLCTIPAQATGLEAPKGRIVLSVTGNITNTNAEGVATFDMEMLQAMAGRSATMETPWTNGKTTFEGPLLRAILEAAGASGKTLKVIALNDYAAQVPVEDATGYETILALKMNGTAMSVRDKGPLFMIYPFDLHPELYNEKYFSRSVWQIKEIEVVE